MAELKNIRIAISGLYDYALEELPSLRLALPGAGAPDYVEKKNIYKVYRPANVLAAACDKFKLLPLTHHHPQTPVDGQNFRDLAIGYTGENPWVDYLKDKDEVGIRSSVMLYDDEAFEAYDRGERQLSPGYIANFEWVQNGKTPKGEPYDIIMTAITDVNHLALLPAGRGGEDAIVMDARKTYQVGEISETTGLQKKSDGSWGKPESAHGNNENAEIEKNLENSKIVEKPYKEGDNFFKLDSDLLDINGHISKENGAIIDQIYFSDKYAEDPTEESTIDPKVKGKGYATKGVIKAIDHFKERGFDTFKVDTMSPYSAKLMKRLEEKGVVKPLSNWRFDGDTVEYKILKTSDEVHDEDVHISIFDLVRKHEVSDAKEFNESDVNRDAGGKFASKGESASNIEAPKKEEKKNDGRPQFKNLSECIDTILKGDAKDKEALKHCFFKLADTPEKLKKAGLRGEYFTITYGVISHHKTKDTDHKLTSEEWKQICEKIKDPIAISSYQDKKDCYNLYLDIQHEGKPLLVGVEIKNGGRNLEVNAVKTVFAKEMKNITKDAIYVDKKITSDQQAVLDGTNSRQYRAVERSTDNIAEGTKSVKLNNCYMTIFDRVKGTVFDLYK